MSTQPKIVTRAGVGRDRWGRGKKGGLYFRILILYPEREL